MGSEGRHRYTGPPATLGSTLRAHAQLIVTCRSCGRQVEPDIAAQVARYGDDVPLPEWGARLTCSGCGSRDIYFVVSGSTRWGFTPG